MQVLTTALIFPTASEGDREGAGVPDARALTLGEELTRSLAVAGDGLGEPVSAEVREGLPEALLQGVSDREPEGEPETRADGDALPVALSSAVAPAVGVCEEEGGGVPVAPPLALAAGLSEGELVAAEEALPPGVAEVGKVGLAPAVTSGEALGEAVGEALEETDGEGLEVAEGAAVLVAAGEVDWDTLKAPEGVDRKEAEEEGEKNGAAAGAAEVIRVWRKRIKQNAHERPVRDRAREAAIEARPHEPLNGGRARHTAALTAGGRAVHRHAAHARGRAQPQPPPNHAKQNTQEDADGAAQQERIGHALGNLRVRAVIRVI